MSKKLLGTATSLLLTASYCAAFAPAARPFADTPIIIAASWTDLTTEQRGELTWDAVEVARNSCKEELTLRIDGMDVAEDQMRLYLEPCFDEALLQIVGSAEQLVNMAKARNFTALKDRCAELVWRKLELLRNLTPERERAIFSMTAEDVQTLLGVLYHAPNEFRGKPSTIVIQTLVDCGYKKRTAERRLQRMRRRLAGCKK